MPVSYAYHSPYSDDIQNARDEEMRCEADGCTDAAVGACVTKGCYCQMCAAHLVGNKCSACAAEETERIMARNRGIMATRLRRFEDAEEMRWQLSRYRHIGPFEGLEYHQEIDQ